MPLASCGNIYRCASPLLLIEITRAESRAAIGKLPVTAYAGKGGAMVCICKSKCLGASAIAVLFVVSASCANRVHAGELAIYNLSSEDVECSVDGYGATREDGAHAFKIAPGQRLTIPPSLERERPGIDFVDCGHGLRTRAMHVTPGGENRTLYLNGHQHRVLNVMLYPYLPTDPALGFDSLVKQLVQSYQSKHNDVLLNLVIEPNSRYDPDRPVDPYDFKSLRDAVLGASGFDVAEIDTVFLKYLVDNKSISPVSVKGDEPFEFARQAATIKGQLFGIPSWLCSDFIFSSVKTLQNVETFTQLTSLLGVREARPTIAADIDGKWTVAATYIQAYTQMRQPADPVEAMTSAIDREVVARMVKVASFCEEGGSFPCVDGTFHNARDGAVEKAFDAWSISADIGFSERSFYIQLFQTSPRKLYLSSFPWSDKAGATRLIYSDAFVANASTCATAPCLDDAVEFGAFMTSVATKKQIVFSQDLPAGSPPRHLLPASKSFYADEDVKNDTLYQRVATSLFNERGKPYPNSFTPELQHAFLSALCPEIKKQMSTWSCKPP